MLARSLQVFFLAGLFVAVLVFVLKEGGAHFELNFMPGTTNAPAQQSKPRDWTIQDSGGEYIVVRERR